MRLGLNIQQWGKLCDRTEKISDFPVTVGNFLTYFTKKDDGGNFNVAYDPKRNIYSVWYDNFLEKFEDKELINAMFNLFCSMEEI